MQQKTFYSLCQPLFDCYGFNYCAYYRWYSNTEFQFLSTDLSWEQRRLSNNHEQIITNQLPDGQYVLNKFLSDELCTIARTRFNHHDMVVYIKHYHFYTEQFYLALPLSQQNKTGTYLTVGLPLRKFFCYLKSNTHLTFNAMALHYLKPTETEISCSKALKNKARFLEQIHCQQYCVVVKNTTKLLTKRQTLVLILFSQGCSIKMTAKKLGCSPNTIYSHLTDIKSNLQCYSKDELIDVARNNELHLLELEASE